jgi:signal peptidase I
MTKQRGASQAARHRRAKPAKEPPMAQIASFVDLFVWLLVLKSFFLPLFIIPTGSMAETLAGAHATNLCPNCGYEYMIGPSRTQGNSDQMPSEIQCPNCQWVEDTSTGKADGVRLNKKAGDRIMVHGWPYAVGGWLGPRRWDVVVFKNPNEPDVNFIKRLIGLPGETIELINGDVFVKAPGQDEARIAQKTPQAQEALWFHYYDHDYLPLRPAPLGYQMPDHKPAIYYPHWAQHEPEGHWAGLDARILRFNATTAPREAIVFSSDVEGLRPGVIGDQYGYNAPRRYDGGRIDQNIVNDLRVGADVKIVDGDGYVELELSRYESTFRARLHADGRLTLEWQSSQQADWEPLAEAVQVAPVRGAAPRRLALSHADGIVAVELDTRRVMQGDPQRYKLEIVAARRQEARPRRPRVRIAAEQVAAELSHLRIDRDVHYTPVGFSGAGGPGNGVSGNPIRLPDDAYFVLGDNSPSSQDSRLWAPFMLGPHLQEAYQQGAYKIGTVPARDMIGRAFLVYWPGFLPLTPQGPNIVPDLGRVRWID